MRLTLLALAAAVNLVRADAARPTFIDDVLPVLRASCLNCHSDDKQKGGLNLATYAATMAGGSSGAVVTPGQPEKSRLYTLSNHSEEPKMPPKADKIKEASLNILKLWIEQGARENSGSKTMAAKPATVATAIVVKGRPAGPPPMPAALSLDPAVRGRRAGAVQALAASPWAPVVAIGGTRQVLLYNTDTGELAGVLPYAHGQVNSLKFSRNGKLLLAAGGRGGQTGKATLYDIATGKVIVEVGHETDALLAADVSADQSQIAVGGPSKVVRVYSTADRSVIREIKKHTDWVTAVEYSPDGILLASGDRNGGLFVWETPTGAEFFSLRGHNQAITDVAWRGDGNQLASSSEDGTVRLWEMENGRSIKTLSHGGASSVRYAHDGRIVTLGRDKVTRLWDVAGNATKATAALPDIGLRTTITHDGKAVISGDWGGTVKVWATADAKLLYTLDANPAPLSDRVAALDKLLAEAVSAEKSAAVALSQAKEAAAKATTDLAALQKAVTDRATAAATATTRGTAAKAENDKAAAALVVAQKAEAAQAAVLKAATEAASKAKAAAAKAPQDASLKAEADKTNAAAAAATTGHATAKTALTAAQDTVKAAAATLTAAQKLVADTATAAKAAQDKLTAEQAAKKTAIDAVAPLQATVAAATARVSTTKAKLEALRGTMK
jgi:hypothetical protein